MSKVIDFRSGNLFDNVYEHLALPESTFLGTRITKKMILENNDLSSSDKKLVNDVIQSVEWLNALKPETLNIPTYITEIVEYIEIAVLKVGLKADATNRGKLKSTAKLFHTLIPYPVILLLELNGDVAISLADKCINQADSSKLIIKHFYTTHWFNSVNLKNNENEFLNDFSMKNVSSINLYEAYQNQVSMIINLEISHLSQTYTPLIKYKVNDYLLSHSFGKTVNSNRKNILNKIKDLELELNTIKKKIKGETQMKERLVLNLQARKVKDELSTLKTNIIAHLL